MLFSRHSFENRRVPNFQFFIGESVSNGPPAFPNTGSYVEPGTTYRRTKLRRLVPEYLFFGKILPDRNAPKSAQRETDATMRMPPLRAAFSRSRRRGRRMPQGPGPSKMRLTPPYQMDMMPRAISPWRMCSERRWKCSPTPG